MNENYPNSNRILKLIILLHITHSALYKHFEDAYNTDEPHPQKWYNEYIKIENSDLCPELRKLKSLGG